jgi:hypothetical protein
MPIATGSLVTVDDDRGVFKVVEQARGAAPTWWLLDADRRWRAVRASRLHPLGDRCPRHPQLLPSDRPRRRCPTCMAAWRARHPEPT